MALYDYNRAMKQGRRQYQAALSRGNIPIFLCWMIYYLIRILCPRST